MLIFIDESWQASKTNPEKKVGVLAAVSICSNDFNEYSRQLWGFKKHRLGPLCGDIEIKGKDVFSKYSLNLEKKGINCYKLDLARDIFTYADKCKAKAFASIVLEEKEVNLGCADVKLLERPFFFLFERINHYTQEYYPKLTATLVFDDRGITQNQKVSQSVSNFFHLSQMGKSFERIVKVPLFAISSENIGIQIADMIGYLIGRREIGDEKEIAEFSRRVKQLEYKSKEEIKSDDGKKYHRFGFKIVRKHGKDI